MTAVCTDTAACTATSCEGTDYMCTQDKTKCADSGKCSVVDAYDAAKLCDMPVAAAPPTGGSYDLPVAIDAMGLQTDYCGAGDLLKAIVTLQVGQLPGGK